MKAQAIRLIDVFAIGAATIIYNGKNYLEIKEMGEQV